jgi:hypothetical protein
MKFYMRKGVKNWGKRHKTLTYMNEGERRE